MLGVSQKVLNQILSTKSKINDSFLIQLHFILIGHKDLIWKKWHSLLSLFFLTFAKKKIFYNSQLNHIPRPELLYKFWEGVSSAITEEDEPPKTQT
jgi:hypothetical protein